MGLTRLGPSVGVARWIEACLEMVRRCENEVKRIGQEEWAYVGIGDSDGQWE